jgi:putative endopeptidase
MTPFRSICLPLASFFLPFASLVAQTNALRSASIAFDTPSAQTAKQLKGLDLTLLDPKVAPCDNFYEYACGGWLQQNPIPSDRSHYGRDLELEEQNSLVLRAILEKAAAGGSARTANEQKIGDAYATCMDTTAINKQGLAPLQPELDSIGELKSKDELPGFVAALSQGSVYPFFRFDSGQDFVNATEQIADVDQPRLGLPEKGFYLRTDDKSRTLRAGYEKHVASMLTLSGEPAAQAQQDAKSVVAFETELAKASLDNEQRRDPKNLNHRVSLTSFEDQTPAFSFAAFLKGSDAPPIISLNVTSLSYFDRLNQLIASTDLATLKTYLRWVLMHNAPVLAMPEAIDNEAFHFYGITLSGQPEQQPRWKRCVTDIDRNMGEALGQVYVAQRFTPEDKQRTLLLAQDVEAAMGRDIDQLPWMSSETKIKAKEKLHTIANKIGYPDKWRDYSSLTITRGDALENAWHERQFAEHHEMTKIGQPLDRGEWHMSPPTVDAYYDPQMNDVNFPAGILQPPYFDASMDDAVNYGDAGGVIGHEVTHGFDDEGRQFDAQGNFKDWWTPQDTKQFDERADCVVKEYNGFVAVDDLHVNGRLTLGENLADLGGLRIAYLAYLQRAQQEHVDLLKRTDGFTPAQRFFLGYGQGWCEATRPEAMRLRVETDPHSPEKYRVNGVVMNLPEFQQAFGCTAKQPMVASPKTRCSVW